MPDKKESADAGGATPRRGTGGGGLQPQRKRSTAGTKDEEAEQRRKRRSVEEAKASAVEEHLLHSFGLRPDKLLGKGTYSRTRKCRRECDGLWVAVKIVDRTKASARFLSAFLPRELDIAGFLLHPNIVRLYRHFTHGTYTCLSMELASRGDLEQYLTLKGPFRPASPFDPHDQVHCLFRQILEGLSFIHGLGIAHRDLKCSNIFLVEGLKPKIGDFGFARRLGVAEEMSQTFCGSSAYAPPELLCQTPYKCRPSDMWSIGVVFYVSLSTRMPFDDSDVPKMISRQKAGKIPFSKDYFDANAKAFLQALLNPDPELRPTPAQALQSLWFSQPSSNH